MDVRKEAADFLRSRRARITPHQASLPTRCERRRVRGLRREEVALLAGVSVEYYARLERGNLAGASEAVLSPVLPRRTRCACWPAGPRRLPL